LSWSSAHGAWVISGASTANGTSAQLAHTTRQA
jgi:hypothetical protein